MGISSAAKAMGLDFVPVGLEQYDFAIPQEYLELDHVKALIAILQSTDFHARLEELGGYTWEGIGEVILV
jgi:putative molybdopterin biosynthesis protein